MSVAAQCTQTLEPSANLGRRRLGRDDFERQVLPLLRNLRAKAAQLTRNDAEAEDLLQDTLTRGWLFFERFEPGSNLYAWLRRIMFNLYVSGYHRARRAQHSIQHVAWAGERTRHAEREASEPPSSRLRDALVASLARLPAAQRDLFWAVYACDMSYQQAAVAFACPVGTVMSRLHRTRQSLRRRLKLVAREHGFTA